ncbi:MAG TPA: ectonucleotide pyrophosphatase/phosphodiesterase [Vicinamibacterales bacterium]|jgi:predicted AlkP superfamily pyrophosphatase or phosphodiesterase|nr:ectonucleotide pyrophosphatase/phosphodiesterase [Vicinamibacterales bacterium]
MWRKPTVITALALAISATIAAAQRDAFADLQPTVILISFDGFRWDYTSKVPTPNLRRLMTRGVHARNLIPSFPSKTFPNHYTIATGLYPGHHGIVANNIFDPPTGRTFATTKREEVRDPMWWAGTPLWTLMEAYGRRSAPLYWPGSEAPHEGLLPTYWQPYDNERPGADRIDQLLTWIDLPTAQRPQFLTAYFEDTDESGHDHGPDSQQVRDAITRDDSYVGRLVAGLTQRGILNRVNVVVVSDHGMAAVDDEHVIVADDYVTPDEALISNINPDLSLFPTAGREDAVYAKLMRAHPHLKMYRRAETPVNWHFRDATSPRVPPLMAIADPGWQILRRSVVDNIRAGKATGIRGQHGWDPQLMSMRAIFIAAGPAFKRGVTVAPFENVSIYNVVAKILQVPPKPNDGDPSVLRAVLRN